MGLPKIMQIPCNHVLANKNALKLKKGAPLKQIFNITPIIIMFFQVFLVFGVAGPFKSMPSGYSLDAEFNSASNELSQSKFE